MAIIEQTSAAPGSSGAAASGDSARSCQVAIEAAEEWLRARGVPHFVLEVPAPAPATAVAHVVVGVGIVCLIALVLAPTADISVLADLALIVGVTLVGLRTWASWRSGQSRLRRHGGLTVPYSVLALAVVAGQAIQAAWGGLDARGIIALAAGLLAIPLLAAATPAAMGLILWWALGHPFRELRRNLKVLAGALPLLLLTVAFLFLTNELWQTAEHQAPGQFWALLALFAALMVAFLLALVRDHVDQAARFNSWKDVFDCLGRAQLGNEPSDDRGALERLLAWLPERALKRLFMRPSHTRESMSILRAYRQPEGKPAEPELEWHERWNIDLVFLFGQGVQVAAVTLMMGVFFLVFGALTVNLDELNWVGTPHDGLWLWKREHLRVSAMLAAFAGLSYTVFASLFEDQRKVFFGELDRKVRQRLAVRALYRELKRSQIAAADEHSRM